MTSLIVQELQSSPLLMFNAEANIAKATHKSLFDCSQHGEVNVVVCTGTHN